MAALTITAANVKKGTGAEIIHSGFAGTTVTAGQPVFTDAADTQLKPSDANDVDKAAVAGISLHGALDDQPLAIIRSGELNLGAILTAGTQYFLGAAAVGTIVPFGDLTTGDRVIRIGWAKTTSILVVDIEDTGVVLA